MIDLSTGVILTSFAFLSILSITTLIRPGKILYKSYLVATAMILGLGELFLGFLTMDSNPPAVLSHARYAIAFMIILPSAALPFFYCLAREDGDYIIQHQRIKIISLTALLIFAALLLKPEFFIEKIHFSTGGPFWGFTFTPYGKGLAIYALVSNIFYMHLFENTYRLSNVAGKVTLKYPMLGMILATVINFILISYLLATSVIDVNFLAVHACGVIICSTTFIYANIRYELSTIGTGVSSKESKSVLTITVSGIYFIVLAIISYISAFIDMPYSRIIMLVPTIFIIFLIIAGIISGKFRRRFRLFLNENFYPNRYNYRKHWYNFSKLMSSSFGLSDLLSNAIASICETMMAKRGVIWVDIKGGKADSYNFPLEKMDNNSARRLNQLTGDKSTVILSRFSHFIGRKGEDQTNEPGGKWDWIKIIAPLGEGKQKQGFIALGGKHWNLGYNVEDREFLETIAMEVSLNLENLMLEEKMIESKQLESFSRFASHIIHDLKNTVGMLSLSTENARDNINDPLFQEDLISTLERSVEKMRSLISSLSSLKTGGSTTRSTINLNSLIQQKLEKLKRLAQSHEVILEYKGTENVELELDREAINRALENIIYNAIEATPPGGRVAVKMDKGESKTVEIQIRDTGTGFDPQYLEQHLFTPFKSTKNEGLGLGLTISRNIVEAHGGGLEVKNISEGGACVTIRLPC